MTREDQIARVTLAGSVVNLLLVGVKFVAGIAGHSAAMISDAVHSLSDFVTDIVVLVFVRISAQPQDEGHDYGHGKFETMATLLIGLALAAAAIGIVVSGAGKLAAWLQGEDLPSPGKLALWAALLSILAKEVLYQYTRIKGQKLDSPALEANAWHHRSDALSSVGAAIGIGGAILLGNRWTVLDPLASIVVGLMLVKVAWDLLGPSFRELTDSSLPKDQSALRPAVPHRRPHGASEVTYWIAICLTASTLLICSFLGMWTFRTPFSTFASILSASASSGSRSVCWNFS